ncbi:MAG: hypothetical protein AAFP17_08905 [Pseudomonadota bacterium]
MAEHPETSTGAAAPALTARLGSALPFVGYAVAIVGLAYVLWKALAGGDPTDLKFIWMAGRIWADGGNPYDTALFIETAREVNKSGALPTFFPYPPQWWPFATGIEGQSLDAVAMLWRLATAPLLIATVALVYASIPADRRYGMPVAAFFLGLGCLMSAVPFTIALTQTAIVITFGAGLFVYGFVRQHFAPTAAGLFILALKPSVGALFIPLILFLPAPMLTIAVLAGALGIATLPGLLSIGLIPVIEGYVDVVSNYATHDVNKPHSITGLQHILWRAGTTLPGSVSVLIGMAALGALAFAWHRLAPAAPARAQEQRLFFVTLYGAGVLAFAPLHVYDFVLLIPLLVAAPALRPLEAGALGLAFLAVMRSHNVALITGLRSWESPYAPGTTIDSIAAVLLFAVLLLATVMRLSRRTTR